MLRRRTRHHLSKLDPQAIQLLLFEENTLSEDEISNTLTHISETYDDPYATPCLSKDFLETYLQAIITEPDGPVEAVAATDLASIPVADLVALLDHPKFKAGLEDAQDTLALARTNQRIEQRVGFTYPGDKITNDVLAAACWSIVAAAELVNTTLNAIDDSSFTSAQIRAATVLTATILLTLIFDVAPASILGLLLALKNDDMVRDAIAETVAMARDHLDE